MKSLFHLSSIQFARTWVDRIVPHPVVMFELRECCFEKNDFIAIKYNHMNCIRKVTRKVIKFAVMHLKTNHSLLHIVKQCDDRDYLLSLLYEYPSILLLQYLNPVRGLQCIMEISMSKNLICAMYISRIVGWTSYCGSWLALRRKYNTLLHIIRDFGYSEYNSFLFIQVASNCYTEAACEILRHFPKEIVNECDLSVCTDMARHVLNLPFPFYRHVLTVHSIFCFFKDCNYDSFVDILSKIDPFPSICLSIMITSENFNMKTLRFFINYCKQKNIKVYASEAIFVTIRNNKKLKYFLQNSNVLIKR